MNLTGEISLERILFLVFLVGNLVERLKATRASLKSQGERLGAVEDRVAKLEGKRDGGR